MNRNITKYNYLYTSIETIRRRQDYRRGTIMCIVKWIKPTLGNPNLKFRIRI